MIFYTKMSTMLNVETQSLVSMGMGNVFTQQIFLSIIADVRNAIVNLDDDSAIGRRERVRLKAQLEIWEDMLEASKHMADMKVKGTNENSML